MNIPRKAPRRKVVKKKPRASRQEKTKKKPPARRQKDKTKPEKSAVRVHLRAQRQPAPQARIFRGKQPREVLRRVLEADVAGIELPIIEIEEGNISFLDLDTHHLTQLPTEQQLAVRTGGAALLECRQHPAGEVPEVLLGFALAEPDRNPGLGRPSLPVNVHEIAQRRRRHSLEHTAIVLLDGRMDGSAED
jgi:hypothetical protein